MTQGIRDTKASPAYVQGKSFYDGSSLRFNSTPGDESFEFLHKSGSSIKFGSDGSISIIAEKDIQIRAKNGVNSHIAVNGDFDIDVSKEMKIKCAKYDLDGGKAIRENAKVISTKAEKEYVLKGEDISVDGANVVNVDSNSLTTRFNAQEHKVEGIFLVESDHGIGFKQNNIKGGIQFDNAGFWTNDVGMSMYTTVEGIEQNTKVSGNHQLTVDGISIYKAAKIYLN